jgi:hypothetical protein
MISTTPLAQGNSSHFPSAASRAIRPSRSRAFTLIEILVSLTITLMMMGAVVTLFQTMSDSVSGSRSIIELTERLRSCRNRLQADLQGATATMLPPLRPENDEGYFEYIEGPLRDLDWLNTTQIMGDNDDVLMFTVRTRAEPFVGKFNGTGTIESPVAEVMYFAIANGPVVDAATTPVTRLCTLYRRVLLVAPGQRGNLTLATNFYDQNDISIRLEGATVVPNTLGDLTKRENRFAHYPRATTPGPPVDSGFPYDLNNAIPGSPANRPNNLTNNPSLLIQKGNSALLVPLAGDRLGDDVLMTNVLAFDVQVYDPNIPLRQSGAGTILTPTDPGFSTGTAVTGNPMAAGAFVDLGYNDGGAPAPAPLFSSNARRDILTGLASVTNVLAPTLPSVQALNLNTGLQLNPLPPATLTGPFTYDTWSLHYENDGLIQNTANATADLGTNGIDDDSNGIVDDTGEYETHPPFPSALRGIRVIIRAYEPSSQQVREVSVEQDFLPE